MREKIKEHIHKDPWLVRTLMDSAHPARGPGKDYCKLVMFRLPERRSPSKSSDSSMKSITRMCNLVFGKLKWLIGVIGCLSGSWAVIVVQRVARTQTSAISENPYCLETSLVQQKGQDPQTRNTAAD